MDDSPVVRTPRLFIERYDTHVPNAWVQDNRFVSKAPEQLDIPPYLQARDALPEPFWASHPAHIACYWRAWELAFGNLKQPSPENGFVANYCDTAFNGNLFMWDSAFVTGFGGYGRRAFNFQKTLDNFYRKQHPDGFICREISEADGQDLFHRFDPSSTGPNVLAWAEWNDFLKTGDRQRLEAVFPPLVAYHQWLRAYRTWPDGSYWSTGWGSGMDNLPRVGSADHIDWGHGHMTWVDATFQAILSAKTLLRMGAVLGLENRLADLREEVERLSAYANRFLWDEKTAFYYDRYANGELSTVKHIGAYWALLAGCVPENRLSAFLSHLENPAEFNRTHRIPALSADDPGYFGTGGYWCGGVWAPTNFMVLKGLDGAGCGDLAHRIGLNHNENVVRIFESENTPWLGADQFRQYFHLPDLRVDDRHTLWEDYAADAVEPGAHSKPGYVGWTGLPPVAVLFEDIFGIIPDAPSNRLTWNVRLLEEHGVRRYPFGTAGRLDLKCLPRKSQLDRPQLELHADVPFTLELIWEGGRDIIPIESKTRIPVHLRPAGYPEPRTNSFSFPPVMRFASTKLKGLLKGVRKR